MSQFNISEDAQSGGELSGSQSSCNELNTASSQPTESAFPDEDEETITMLDVIEREDKLEEEASAVLGNSDEKNCTYPKGYISRQALYSCATCSDGSDNFAAICLACSLECHDNHDVIELYTKRNYRCDCGNSKFKPEFRCKLLDKESVKSPLNENNKYNHNFSGRYCVCNKMFPPEEGDDSAESNDEMWQCIVCEDWYHTKHLGTDDLPSKFEELICPTCVDELDFVRFYKGIDLTTEEIASSQPIDDSSKKVEITNNNELKVEPNAISATPNAISVAGGSRTLLSTVSTETPKGSNSACESDTNDSLAENKDPVQKNLTNQTSSSSSSPSPSTTKSACLLDKLKESCSENSNEKTIKGPIFWADCSWRAKLCRCQNCLAIYKEKNCEYLLDDKDTVNYYEAQGKAIAMNSQTPIERGMTALKGMNRVAVAEALSGYNELKADLSSYLRKFADSKKVVREQDIHEFFQQLKSKKRPRLEYE